MNWPAMRFNDWLGEHAAHGFHTTSEYTKTGGDNVTVVTVLCPCGNVFLGTYNKRLRPEPAPAPQHPDPMVARGRARLQAAKWH